MADSIPVLHAAVGIMTPLLFAATGGLFTELSGALNIALEGQLLLGAFAAVTVTHFSGSIAAGILAGILASMLLAALVAFLSFRLKANVFIAALAANLFAPGITTVLSHKIFSTRGIVTFSGFPKLKTLSVDILERIPVVSELFMNHSIYVYCSWLLLFTAWLALYKTPFGFHLRSCELHSRALMSLGIKSGYCRFIAFLVSGFCCGVGGSMLTISLGAFVPNISAGKGWIALVVIFLGNRRPLGLFAAALLFGLAESFSNYAQGIFNVPADFILAIPYVFTLAGMIGISAYTKRKNRVMQEKNIESL
ncbi:MAG: ABC transporter permease [Treponema sp.]|jgi:simple sugar transport system permease protein|nr:ABC transporter permease [Treponema sp.]